MLSPAGRDPERGKRPGSVYMQSGPTRHRVDASE